MSLLVSGHVVSLPSEFVQCAAVYYLVHHIVRDSFMPLYCPVIICTVLLSCLDAVIGSVVTRVIIRTVILIFTTFSGAPQVDCTQYQGTPTYKADNSLSHENFCSNFYIGTVELH